MVIFHSYVSLPEGKSFPQISWYSTGLVQSIAEIPGMTDAIPFCLELLELLELLVLFDTWARRSQVGFSRRRLQKLVCNVPFIQFWEVWFVHHWVENSVDFFWVYPSQPRRAFGWIKIAAVPRAELSDLGMIPPTHHISTYLWCLQN